MHPILSSAGVGLDEPGSETRSITGPRLAAAAVLLAFTLGIRAEFLTFVSFTYIK
jgi:hypothetical protein